MRIIVLGAGKVGTTLAQKLAAEKHDIVVVDQDKGLLDHLQERYEITTIQGHAAYPGVLRQAGAKDADMVVAVTDSDEVNMIACQVAYSIFNTPTKIARVRSPHYFIRKELFGSRHMPVDVFISPEQLVIRYIQDLIDHPGALQVLNFADGLVKLMVVKPYYGGAVIGKPLSQLRDYLLSVKTKVVAIFRNNESVPITDDTLIEVGDEVFFVAQGDHIHKVLSVMRRVDTSNKRIFVGGGGHIGFGLSKVLENNYQVKVIDRNLARCNEIARELDFATVLNGDVSDKELLLSENIDHSDVFCAVTDDDEANIMSCIQAKRLGAKMVMALVARATYVDMIEGSGINIAISPEEATASSILAHIRKGDVVNVHSLRRGAAEAIEAIAHGDEKTSAVIGRKMDNLPLPKDATIGAIIRKKEVIIPNHDTVIQPDDHVILFVANRESIKEVEQAFQVAVTFMG